MKSGASSVTAISPLFARASIGDVTLLPPIHKEMSNGFNYKNNDGLEQGWVRCYNNILESNLVFFNLKYAILYNSVRVLSV